MSAIEAAEQFRPSASERVAAIVARMINLGEFRPGERLPAADELAAQIGVSRPIVLQALRRLEEQGLIKVRRKDGTRVAERSAESLEAQRAYVWRNRQEILQVVALREIVEAGAAWRIASVGMSKSAEKAARSLIDQMRATDDEDAYLRLDVAFHARLTESLDLPVLDELLRDSRAKAAPVLIFLPHPPSRTLHTVTDEHERMLDAIVARDPAAAAQAAEEHIRSSARHIVKLLRGDGAELFRTPRAPRR